MSTIYFILMIVFLVLWISNRGKNKSNNEVDYKSKTYAQGYWDGYRAHQKESSSTENNDDNQMHDLMTEKIPDGEFGDLAEIIEADNEPESLIDESEIRAKRSLQNINTALYVASFLLVASAAIFVGTTLLESVRFVGVWVVTALFYVVGLYLYENSQKLRPAAKAFVGTGLSILPFTGIAMYNFVMPDPAFCWFLTSVIGLLAFILAAIRLKSQVISYFAIAFMISMATSSVATIGAGMIWYFVVLILFGSLMTFMSIIKPKLIPSYFAKPIQLTNQWIVPLTLVASIISTSSLSLSDYWIITIVSTIYYIAVAVSTKSNDRDIAILFARLLASITVLLVAYDVTDSWMITSITLSAIGALQAVVSSMLLPKHIHARNNNELFLWTGFVMQLIAPVLLLGCEYWGYVLLLQLSIITLSSFGLAYIMRRTEIASFGIFSLAILPILIGLEICKPALDMQWIALMFVALSYAAIALRSVLGTGRTHPLIRFLTIAGYAVFTMEALLFTYQIDSVWGFAIWLMSAILAYYMLYIERNPQINLVANFMTFISIIWLSSMMNVAVGWKAQFVSWVSLAIFYGGHLLFTKLSKRSYAPYYWYSAVVTSGVISFFGLFNYSASTEANLLMLFAAAGLILVSLALIHRGWTVCRYGLIDFGVILVTIAFQRLASVNMPNLDALVYTHWWAIVVFGLGYFYYCLGKYEASKVRAIIALSFITIFTGAFALGGTSDYLNVMYKNIFLVEHILILIIGLAMSRKLFSTWGAVGVALAVLWMLAGYTYLLLAFAAFVLIGAAIYALHSQSQNKN